MAPPVVCMDKPKRKRKIKKMDVKKSDETTEGDSCVAEGDSCVADGDSSDVSSHDDNLSEVKKIRSDCTPSDGDVEMSDDAYDDPTGPIAGHSPLAGIANGKSATPAKVAEVQRLRTPLFGSNRLPPTLKYESCFFQAMDALFRVPADPETRKHLSAVSDLFNSAFTHMRDELVLLRARERTGPAVVTKTGGSAMTSKPGPSAMPIPTDEWQTVRRKAVRAATTADAPRPRPRSRTPRAKAKVPTFSAVVSATNVGETAETLKGKIMSMDDADLPIRIKSIRSDKNNVVIETVTQQELDQLIACAKFGDKQMAVKKAEHGDMVYVPGVTEETPLERFMEQLRCKNLTDVTKEIFEASVHVSRYVKPLNGNKGGILLEVGEDIAKALLANGRIYIGFMSYPIRAWREGADEIPRCYRCMGFGHYAARCSKDTNLCGNCGSAGHFRATCTEVAKCWLCASLNLDSNHSIASATCTEYRRARQAHAIRNRNA